MRRQNRFAPLRALVAEARPLALEECVDKPARVVNVVSTVQLLYREDAAGEPVVEKINALALVMKHFTCCKFDPSSFAAVVIRVRDGFTTTGLIFDSGNMVVVGAKSIYQSLYACQKYRQLVENVYAPYYNAETKKTEMHTLHGRTTFHDFHVQNMVAHVQMGGYPNLPELLKSISDICTWNPELFPSLNLTIWKTPKSACACKKKKANNSCRCNNTVLLFDTGKMVITGARNHFDLNYTRATMLALLEDDKFQETGALVPSSQRFEMRRAKMLRMGLIELNTDMQAEPAPKKRRVKLKTKTDVTRQMHAFIDTIQHMQVGDAGAERADETLTPLAMAALHLQEETVQMLLELNPAYVLERDARGLTALERLQGARALLETPAGQRIAAMLQSVLST